MPNKLNIYEEFDPSLPLIKINRDLMMQVLDNIFINAYESSLSTRNSYLKIQTRFVVERAYQYQPKRFYKKILLKISICDNGKEFQKNQ